MHDNLTSSAGVAARALSLSTSEVFESMNKLESMHDNLTTSAGLAARALSLSSSEVFDSMNKLESMHDNLTSSAGVAARALCLSTSEVFESLSKVGSISDHLNMSAGLAVRALSLSASEIFHSINDVGTIHEVMNKSAGLIAKSLLIDSDNIFSKFSGEEIYGTLGKASENIRIKENEYEEIVINHDGSVTLYNETVFSDEIQQNVSDAFSDFGDHRFLETFQEKLSNYKRPVQLILYWIFEKIITAYIVGVVLMSHETNLEKIQSYFFPKDSVNQLAPSRKINNIPLEYHFEGSEGYRVVIGDGVRIRESAGTKFTVMAKVDKGQVVRFVKKENKWTLIEVCLDDSLLPSLVSGWVYNKYLRQMRFKSTSGR